MPVDQKDLDNVDDVTAADNADLDNLDFGDNVDGQAAPDDKPATEAKDEVPAAEAKDDKPAAEAKDDKPTKDDQPDSANSQMIPRSRYNSQRDRRVEAERRAAELEQQLTDALARDDSPTVQDQLRTLRNDIAGMDKDIEQARADGNVDRVTQLLDRQRNMELQLIASLIPDMDNASARAADRAYEVVKMDEIVTQAEQDYPQFDRDSDKYDEDLNEEALTLFEALTAKGQPASSAMQRAIAYVVTSNGLETSARPAPAARRTTNVEKNLAAAAAQPPEPAGAGMDSSAAGVTKALDVMHMSQEAFEKLGDDEEARLRGDFDI